MDNLFEFEIITPLYKFCTLNIQSVILNIPTGKYGVKKYHEPVILSLNDGKIKILEEQKWIDVYITAGFAEVTKLKTTIFVEKASYNDDLNIQLNQDKKIRDKEAIQRKNSKIEHIKMQNYINKAMNNIKVEKKKLDVNE